jgi:hypothetical protein
MNCRLFSLVAAVLAGGFVFFVLPAFGFDRLNCQSEEIDLSTGKIRTSRFFLFVRVEDRIVETMVSEATQVAEGQPDWRTMPRRSAV